MPKAGGISIYFLRWAHHQLSSHMDSSGFLEEWKEVHYSLDRGFFSIPEKYRDPKVLLSDHLVNLSYLAHRNEVPFVFQGSLQNLMMNYDASGRLIGAALRPYGFHRRRASGATHEGAQLKRQREE